MNRLQKIIKYYNWGGRFVNDPYHKKVKELTDAEIEKRPFRYEIINYLLSHLNRETIYLEIGVRNPDDNFNKIQSNKKYSVDPGIEFKENPVDFKVTSDVFFERLRKGEYLSNSIKFDVIFIDGLHLAEQVEKDIENALEFIKEDGFIVLHDCNPPSEWHAREAHNYVISPAGQQWNGTTWKAFLKTRYRTDVYSCCIDTDWGIGIVSKKINLGNPPLVKNDFFEFNLLEQHRKKMMNVITFDNFKNIILKHHEA